ncbi:hypothetical protein WMY93_014848 [Mugilogobius chulae]|uniref:EF-hand domain-containing protein n=1 Tax=Mugilogobius chulae TaxID=88201 RepID=A0AAW0NWI6_9GOBI
MCEPCGTCEILPPLDVCVRGILEVFDRHASRDDDTITLSKKEARGLFKKELGPMMEGSKSPVKLKDFFAAIDQNGDQKLDFPEFMAVLGFIACVSNNRLCEMPPERCGPSLPIGVLSKCGPTPPM